MPNTFNTKFALGDMVNIVDHPFAPAKEIVRVQVDKEENASGLLGVIRYKLKGDPTLYLGKDLILGGIGTITK